MFHKSKVDDYAAKFPHDASGHVPVETDCWREMQFEHEDMDPNEEGISAEEKERRIKYLDTEWWPAVLQRVAAERQRLEHEHGESFIKHWQRVVNQPPDAAHGFEAEPSSLGGDE